MPELPEVEVLKRSLEPLLVGEQIESTHVFSPGLREPLRRRRLQRRLDGQRIEALRRRAKYLLIDTEGGSTLVVHLGMSGRLTLAEGRPEPEKHEHVAFDLSSGRRLRFRDPRRFGLCFAAATNRLSSDRHFKELGVEPLAQNAGTSDLSGAQLRQLAAGRRAPVKSFLMDARTVVGIGNIYACEALYRAGVHPRRSVARISAQRWDAIADAAVAVLRQAIEEGGTTLNDFANGKGEPGYFQVSLAVYGREGEPCSRCAATLRRIVQSNRSTFYCPRCQR